MGKISWKFPSLVSRLFSSCHKILYFFVATQEFITLFHVFLKYDRGIAYCKSINIVFILNFFKEHLHLKILKKNFNIASLETKNYLYSV